MKKLIEIVKSFFDIRRSIKAKIFVSLLIATISITSFVSLYWYRTAVETTQSTIVENMSKSIEGSRLQLDNAFDDVRKMHATLVYGTNSLEYILKKDYNPPDAEWFSNYRQTLSGLQTMNANLARTISGIGIFKMMGETCLTGTLSLTGNVLEMDAMEEIERAQGSDVIFYTPKEAQRGVHHVSAYVFVGKLIVANGKKQAVMVTKVNENILVTSLSTSICQDGFALLINENHDILYDSAPREFTELKRSYIEGLKAGAASPGTDDFYLFTSKSEATGITIMSAVPQAYVRQMDAKIQAQIMVLLITVLLAVAGISMVVSNKITLGLQCLISDMKKVGGGSMTNLKRLETDDEIGQLSENFLNMIAQIQQLMQNIKNNEKQKREMEIKVLRAQVSPHFLYNSLNTINYLALLQKAENIQLLTSSLIELLHGTVEIDDRLVTVSDEISYVKSYINIQQYRYPHKIHVDFQISPEACRLRVPRMILQPIVENALIHGLGNGKIDSAIRIKVYIEGNTLYFCVTDNGIGMTPERIKQVMENKDNQNKMRLSGIGIGNVDSRVKMQMGEKYGISIYSQAGVFTTVEIKLPVIEEIS